MPLLAGLLGLTLFVVIWVSVCLVLSFAGGWRSLARAYRAPVAAPVAAPKGAWVERRAVFSGAARYKNVLRLRADEAGVYLSVVALFRIGHPPLFVPWEDLFATPAASAPPGYTEVRFRKVTGPRLLVSKEALETLDATAPRPWRAT